MSGPNLTSDIPSSVGTQTYTLVVNESNFSSSVTQVTFTFNLVVTCVVSSIVFNSPPASDALDYLIDTQPKLI